MVARTCLANAPHAIVLVIAVAATHACIIDPQKDFPIGTTHQQHDGGFGGESESAGGAADGGTDSGVSGSESPGGEGGAPGNPTTPAPTDCVNDDECSVGQTCVADSCRCVPCAATGIPSPSGSCIAPATAVVEGEYGATDIPPQAIDGDATTAWSSGAYAGHLTITFPTPTPVASLILLPNASPNSAIDYTILIEGPGSTPPKVLTPVWTSADATPWIAAPLLEPQLVTKITIDATSTTTWISLWEVMMTKCVSVSR